MTRHELNLAHDERVTAVEAQPHDIRDEVDLRPRGIDEFQGQSDVVAHLRILLSAARQRGQVADHILLAGPPGLGKTSLAGIVAIPPDPIYGLTKHAMVGLVKSLGPALEPHGVCISALCPGFVDTPLVTDVTRDFIKAFSSDVLDVSVAGDLAMRALTERIPGSQWTVSHGHPIQQYVPNVPFV